MDVAKIMRGAGNAWLGIGMGSGEKRAEIAAKNAITSPLLEMSLSGAKGIVTNISGNKNISLHEVEKAMQIINQTADTDVNSIFGVTIDEELGDQIKIVLIATSFQPKYAVDKQLYDLDKDLISSEDLKIPSFLRKKKKEEEE